MLIEIFVKMILKIIFDLLFFTNFHIPIDEVITALSNKNFEQIYPTTNQTAGLETKRIADTLVFKSPNQLTRDEAIAFCQRNQALLYTIESRDDLDSIFDQLQVNDRHQSELQEPVSSLIQILDILQSYLQFIIKSSDFRLL